MQAHRFGRGFGGSAFSALIAVSLAACGGGGGGGAGGGSATSGSGGAATCPAPSTFQGQPGTLWVELGGTGELTSFDTQDGKLLKTIASPGHSTQITGGLGLLWLENTNNNKDVIPFDPVTAKAMPPIGISPDDLLAPGAGKLWTISADAANVNINTYSIASPTSITSLTINDGAVAYAADVDGIYYLASSPPDLSDVHIAHVDAANSAIAWTLTKTELPALADWAASTGVSSMIVVGGKLFVKGQSSPADRMFVVDLATKTQLVSATLAYKSDTTMLGQLMTDGTGLYAFGESTLYEIDQATLAAKRELALDQKVYGTGAPMYGGGIWLGILCNGETYIRRIDAATFAIADILYPSGKGEAPQAYAFLAQ